MIHLVNDYRVEEVLLQQIPHVKEVKNLIGFARKRHEKSMAQKLAGEIMAGYKEEGGAFKRKEDTHRMADANKAFSHFRF